MKVSSSAVLLFFLGSCFSASLQAASLAGFLVFPPGPDSNNGVPRTVPFSEIFWQSPSGGTVTTLSGSSTSFNKADVREFVYLDEGYFQSIRTNPSYVMFGGKLGDREVVVPRDRPDISTDADIQPYVAGSQALARVIKALPDLRTTLKPVQDNLDGEITHYQKGERKLKGQWLNSRDLAERSAAGAVPAPGAKSEPNEPDFDITTVDGKTYKNATRVKVSHDAVTFLYADGGAKLDLSMLTSELQQKFGYDAKSREDRKALEEKFLADAGSKDPKAVADLQAKAVKELDDFKNAKTKKTLSGQLMVAGKQGEAAPKLPGVQVSIYTASQIDIYLAPKKEKAAAELARLDVALNKAYQNYMDADAAGGTKPTVQDVSASDINLKKAKLQAAIDQVKEDERTYLSPGYFFTDLPPAVAETRADSEGKFNLSLPSGSYVVAAQATHSTASRDDEFWWMVKFKMGEADQSLKLNGDNLTSSDSGDSLIVSP